MKYTVNHISLYIIYYLNYMKQVLLVFTLIPNNEIKNSEICNVGRPFRDFIEAVA